MGATAGGGASAAATLGTAMPRFAAMPAMKPSRYCFWSSENARSDGIRLGNHNEDVAAMQQSPCQMPAAVLHRRSRESGNPGRTLDGLPWTPAFAGVTPWLADQAAYASTKTLTVRAAAAISRHVSSSIGTPSWRR